LRAVLLAVAIRFTPSRIVMAGLDPAIHAAQRHESKTWMPGSSPGMTMLDGPGI
jgi:hypothetical protein